MYAKIKNGSLVAAHLHSSYGVGGKIIVTPSEHELRAQGYKPVVYQEPSGQTGTKEVITETYDTIFVNYVDDEDDEEVRYS